MIFVGQRLGAPPRPRPRPRPQPPLFQKGMHKEQSQHGSGQLMTIIHGAWSSLVLETVQARCGAWEEEVVSLVYGVGAKTGYQIYLFQKTNGLLLYLDMMEPRSGHT